MKKMLKRLFVKLPLYIIAGALIVTIVAPLIYWVVTGKNFTDLVMEIDYI